MYDVNQWREAGTSFEMPNATERKEEVYKEIEADTTKGRKKKRKQGKSLQGNRSRKNEKSPQKKSQGRRSRVD